MTTLAATTTDYAASGNALDLYFVPDTDWNGITTFDYAAKDNDGLADATAATATITVNAVNDAPTLTTTGTDNSFVGAGAPVNIFTSTTVSTVEAGQLISAMRIQVSGVTPPGSGDEYLTIDGTLINLSNGNTGNTTLFTSFAVSNIGDTFTVTFTGGTATASHLENILDGATYHHADAAPAGGDRIVEIIQIADNGGTANGGDNTSVLTSQISTLSMANVAPTVDLNGAAGGNNYAFTFNEGDPTTTIVDAAVNVADVDDTSLVYMTLDIGGVVDGAVEELTIGNLTFDLNAADFSDNTVTVGGDTYTVNWINVTGVATITLNTGEMSLAQAEAVLLNTSYQHTDTGNPTAGPRTIDVTVNDGDTDSAVAITTITVTGTNDAPQTADVSDSGDEDAASITVTLSGSDVDGTVASFSLSGLPANGTLYTDAGLTTLAATATDYAATGNALDLYFVPDADWNGITTFDYAAKDNDGLADATAATATITVNAVNDAPVVGAPGAALNAAEKTGLPIHGTGFTVGDIDEDGLGALATLSVGEGTLTVVPGNSGVTVTGGNGTDSVTLTGTIEQIDNLLTAAGTGEITYLNDLDTPSASTTLTVTVNDQGNTGTDPGDSGDGSSEEGTSSVTINVAALNDAPVNTVPPTQNTPKDTSLVLSTGNGNLISVDDVDAGNAQVEVTLTATFGKITITGAAGDPIPVTANTSRDQSGAAIARTADGRIVTVWASLDQDGSSWGIFGQRYTSTGSADGVEFPVNSITANEQEEPAVAMDDNGNFVVVWQSKDKPGDSSYGISAQLFDNTGTPVGGEIHVNTTKPDNQTSPEVAMDANGNFVVVWEDDKKDGNAGIFAQRFNSAGAAQGVEFQVNQTPSKEQTNPSVAMDADGDFVVVWESKDQAGGSSSFDIYGRRYNNDGSANGGEFLVNTNTSKEQEKPRVALDTDGDFVVVWQSKDQAGASSSYDVYGQLYDNTGATVGSEFLANTATGSEQQAPDVAMTPSGGFTVVWQSMAQDGDNWGVYAQEDDASGNTLGSETRVNIGTSGPQYGPRIAMDTGGDYVVVWNGQSPADNDGVSAQRFLSTTGLTFTDGTGSNETTMTFRGTLSEVNQAFDGLEFNPDAGFIGTATLQIVTNDLNNTGSGGAQSDDDTIDINVHETYAPQIDLDANDSSGQSGPNFVATFTEDAGPVLIVDGDAEVAEVPPGSTTLDNMTIQLTNQLDGADEVLAATTGSTGITATWNSGLGRLYLEGTASLAAYQQVLQTITYNNASQNPDTTNRIITFQGNDGTANTNSATTTLTVVGVNDEPVIAGTTTTPTATESGTGTNQVALIDPGTGSATDLDAANFAGGTLTVSLDAYVAGDLLSVAGSPAGVDVASGGNEADLVITLDANATPAAMGVILEALRFENTGDNPTAGGDTSRSYTIVLNDGGNSPGPTDKDSNTLSGTINVVGENDLPVANVDSGTTAEDTTISVAAGAGVLTNDTDLDGDTLTVSEVEGNGANVDTQITLGSGALLTLNSDGSYVYDPNGQFENLDIGQTNTDSFNYTISDGQGGTDTATVTVTIDGAEDAPVLGGVITGTVAEDGTQTASGALTITDADDNDNPISFANQGATAGDNNYGSFVLTGGTWTYTLDNAAVQNLDNGQSVTDTITYTATDGTSTQTITVTIDGAEDAPVAVDDANTTSENTPISSVLTLQSNDTDIDGDALSVDASSVGTFATTQGGTIVVAADGHYTYTPAAVFTGIDTFDYTVTDGTLTDTGTLSISVGATNDDPVATDDTGAVDEDATLTVAAINGVLKNNDTDPDGDTLTVGAIRTGTEAGSGTAGTLGSALTGTYGSLTLNADGSYTYIADQAAADALANGVTATDTFTYAASDGKGGTDTAEIVITVTGTNDAATVSAATEVLAETDVPVTTSGTLTSSDVDNPDNTFTAETINGTIGTLTIDAAGAWTFTANSANDNLNVGDSVNETFTVSSIDGTTSTVAITINGTNDAATVSAATEALAETDVPVTASGTLTSTDPDNADDTFTADTIVGTIGTFTIDAAGAWTFTANSAYDNLNTGDNVNETFNVTSVDGTASTVAITINGTNDAATVSAATEVLTETNVPVTASGTLTSTDPDNADNTFTAETIVGTIGTFTIDAAGAWTFTANSAYDNLNTGDNVNETFNVTSVDGTASTVAITINGTNDAATVSAATEVLTETDAPVTASGTLTSSDVDNPDNAFTAETINGTIGTLTIDAAGAWTFTANSAYDNLNVGGSVNETFTVSSIDGTTSTVAITINGTNDGAVAANASAGTNADTVLNGNVPVATDVDGTIDPNGYALDTDVAEGTLTFNADGSYSFDPGSDFDNLATGATRNVTFTYTATDNDAGVSAPATVTITVTGTNDLLVATDPPPPPPIDDTDPDPITPPDPEPEPEPGPEEPPPTEDEEDVSPDTDDLIDEESGDNVTEIPATVAGAVSTQQRLVSNSLREFVQRTLQSVSLALDTDVELGGVGAAPTETQPEWSVVPPRAASMALGTGLTELGIQTIRALDFLENSLDGLKQEAENEMAFNQMAASSAIAVTTGLSIGYVAWLLRSGVLLSSLLSSMPAWRFLDPLPVLAGKFEDDEETDEESLETIIEQPGTPSDDDAPDDASVATDAKET